jgi:hypothetical protein
MCGILVKSVLYHLYMGSNLDTFIEILYSVRQESDAAPPSWSAGLLLRVLQACKCLHFVHPTIFVCPFQTLGALMLALTRIGSCRSLPMVSDEPGLLDQINPMRRGMRTWAIVTAGLAIAAAAAKISRPPRLSRSIDMDTHAYMRTPELDAMLLRDRPPPLHVNVLASKDDPADYYFMSEEDTPVLSSHSSCQGRGKMASLRGGTASFESHDDVVLRGVGHNHDICLVDPQKHAAGYDHSRDRLRGYVEDRPWETRRVPKLSRTIDIK